MNILLTTFGQTWPIIPEIAGLTNPGDVPLFNNYQDRRHLENFRQLAGGTTVDEIWVIMTQAQDSLIAYQKVEDWYGLLQNPKFSLQKFECPGTEKLASAEECRLMTDFILRVFLHAKSSINSGHLLVSLAGGRKTMSADMQRAAYLFGCQLLFHVADSLNVDAVLRSPLLSAKSLTASLPPSEIAGVFPVVVAQNLTEQMVTLLPKPLNSSDYPIHSHNTDLIDTIDAREQQSSNLLYNAYFQRRVQNPVSYFHGLQLLPPNHIQQLENQYIGHDEKNAESEIKWLQELPKADLHCHLGGVLDSAGMIGAALANHEAVTLACISSPTFKAWANRIETAVKQHDELFFEPWVGQWKKLRTLFPDIPPSTTVSAFLSSFHRAPEFLRHLVFGPSVYPENYYSVGIKNYETAGDLQGSALLGSEAVLRFTLKNLVGRCTRENVTYCEVRCSPAKYASEGISIQKVTSIIREELEKSSTTKFKLIIIASRHTSSHEMKEHINLVMSLVEQPGFDDWFAGFDLAGDEQVMSPGKLRDTFDPLLRNCINITIHAGETDKVSNIWEAAYILNADRIGHGLTLKDDPKLLKRFADSGIALEMCPSSNFQIIGYRDYTLPVTAKLPDYPLKAYFMKNLVVTVNTDNRGISDTDLSNEYLKAAQMTPGGLSRWEILQLIRNGFKSAFTDRDNKKKMLIKAEESILKTLTENSY